MTTELESLNKIEWAVLAHPVLQEVYDAGETITYGELAAKIGYPYAIWHQHYVDIIKILGVPYPHLAAIVVRKDAK